MESYYQRNKEKIISRVDAWRKTPEGRIKMAASMRRRRLDVKSLVFNHYGSNNPKCVCCGEKEWKFLTIDHINGRPAEHKGKTRLLGHDLYRWLKINNFPSGYQILCFNCNCAKGFYGKCPHSEANDERKV